MKKMIIIGLLLLPFLTGIAEEKKITLAEKMYATKKAFAVGDLVSIVVNESTTSSKSEDISTDKSASTSATNPLVGGAELSQLAKAINQISTLNNLAVNSSSTFAGTGTASSEETVNAQLTARVVDVMENGNLVIRGERRVKQKSETINVIITGIIRIDDISKTNTINSSKVSDARIVYESTGTVSKSTKPGFFWRIYQFLNPF